MGSAASLQRWDTGSIPSPAELVKYPTLRQLQLKLQLCSDLIPGPGNSISHRLTKKKKSPSKEKLCHCDEQNTELSLNTFYMMDFNQNSMY